MERNGVVGGMGIIGTLLGQSRNPAGPLGALVLWAMNLLDSGLNRWAGDLLNGATGNILDIGCGGGRTIKCLAALYPDARITGLDPSMESVKASTGKNKRLIDAGRVTVVHGSVSRLPFPDGHFGAVTAIRSHYFWPDLPNNLREVHRVMAPGGTLVLLCESNAVNCHMGTVGTAESMISMLENAGFTGIRHTARAGCECLMAVKKG